MARESLISTDRRVLFRETFSPESIARNGGVINGGVSLNGGVATFDGSTGYITYSNSDNVQTREAISIRCKLTKNGIGTNGWNTVFMNGSYTTGYGILLKDDGTLNFYGSGLACSATLTMIDGVGYDCIATFDGTDVVWYIDGVSRGTFSRPGNLVKNSAYGWSIGKSPSGVAYFANISLDLFEIYEGALSESEVKLLHSNNLYSGPVTENLVLDCDYTTGSSRNRSRQYGDNLVVNGGFDTDTDWNKETGWTINGGKASFDGLSNYRSIYQNAGIKADTKYILNYTISDYVSGSFRPLLGGGNAGVTRTSNGVYTEEITTATVSNSFALFQAMTGPFIGSIDNVSVREVLEVTETNVEFKHGVGAEFNGSTSYIDYGAEGVTKVGTNSFTLEVVAYSRLTAPSAYQCVIGRGYFGGGGIAGYGVGLDYGFSGGNYIIAQIRSGASLSNVITAIEYEPGIPFHLIMVRDVEGSNNTFKVYINAVEVGSDVGLAGISLDDVHEFVVGRASNTGSSFPMNGGVSLTRLYKGKALSANEVRQNYTDCVNRGLLNG